MSPPSAAIDASSPLATASSGLTLEALADWLLRTTWQVAVLVAIIGAVHLIAGRRLAPRWRFALWGLVVVRLLLPVTPASAWSLFNLSLPTAALATRADEEVSQLPPKDGRVISVRVVTPLLLPRSNVSAALPSAVPPEAPAAPAAPFDWRLAMIGVWLAGVSLAALRVAAGTAILQRKLRLASIPPDAVRDSFDRSCRQMGLNARIPVLVTDAVDGPALFGFFRPRLLLPPAILRALSPAELRFVFLHELAHVKRRDPLTNAALLLAGAVHWFNPFARFALARCRAERELACDELVMDATAPAARPGYGQAVLRVAESFCAGRAGGPARVGTVTTGFNSAPAIGMIAARSQLRRRIAMISRFQDAPRPHARSILPALLLLGICSCALTDRAPDTDAAAGETVDPAVPGRPSDESVADLTRTSRQLTAEKRYDEALSVVDRILALDPKNEYAVGVRPLVLDKVQLRKQRDGKGPSTIPYDDVLEYRADGADVAGIRDQAGAAGREDPRVRAILERNIPEVTFDAVSLDDVMNFLRDLTEANLLIDWKALEGVGIDRHAPVTVRLRDIPLAKALGIVLDQVGGDEVLLGYMVEGNLIRITTRKEKTLRSIVTRVYDIRDLLIDIPNFTDAPRFGFEVEPPDEQPAKGEPGKQHPPAVDKPPSRAEILKSITDLVKETVDPDSWRDNGGSIGGIRELQGQLIVTQTDDNHGQLVVLLDQLRETRSVQVIVEARFLSVEMGKLEGPLPEKLRQTIGRSDKQAVSVLTDEEVAALLDATQATPDAEVVTAPLISLFNGQRAYVLVAQSKAYVSGYSVVKTEAGETRYEPQTSQVQHGAIFDVAATVSADRKHVTLTLRPKLTALTGMSTAPYVGPPGAPANLTVEVPLLDINELQTTVKIPDRGTLLIGGLRQAAGAPDGAATTQPARDFYLLVKPTLIGTPPKTRDDVPLISK